MVLLLAAGVARGSWQLSRGGDEWARSINGLDLHIPFRRLENANENSGISYVAFSAASFSY